MEVCVPEDTAIVVLRDDLHGIVVGIYLNIRMGMYGTDQAGLGQIAPEEAQKIKLKNDNLFS